MRRKRIAAIVAACAAAVGVFNGFVNYLEPNEVGITWNWITGETSLQSHGGLYVTPPWVWISNVDTRPTRVCITSGAHAAVNCRLVQFVPEHYRDFVRVQGFGLYWWSNRISFNTGYREEYRGMKDIMRGYAFSAEQYPFIRVLNEY